MSSALLVVDVQEALFRPQPRPADADATVARINALAARARREKARRSCTFAMAPRAANWPVAHRVGTCIAGCSSMMAIMS